jgi:MFS family permease
MNERMTGLVGADGKVDSRRSWVVVSAAFASMFTVFGIAYSFGAFFSSMIQEFGAGKGAGSSFAWLVVFAVIMGIAYGGFIALSPSVTAEVFGLAGLGEILGALYTAAGIGVLVGPPMAGLLIDVSNSYTVVILVAMMVSFGAFVCLLRVTTLKMEI